MVSLSVPQNLPWALDGERHDSNRHRKGDTYLIGGKPYDPLDPGPWLWKADPEFQPDRRTGRHRRGELPDPLPEARRPRPYPDQAAIFQKMREDAWARFLDGSAILAQAHTAPSRRGRFKAALLRVLRRISNISRAVRTAS